MLVNLIVKQLSQRLFHIVWRAPIPSFRVKSYSATQIDRSSVALSPDGRQISYLAPVESGPMVAQTLSRGTRDHSLRYHHEHA